MLFSNREDGIKPSLTRGGQAGRKTGLLNASRLALLRPMTLTATCPWGTEQWHRTRLTSEHMLVICA